jgi:cytoskeletal protein CcmA (bactofilin family)
VNSNLLFTDNTYDIGASGATRPRNLFLAGAATVGGNLSVGGTLTLTGGVNLNGNVTVGDNSSDTLTINSTITSNLLFTDNTYDIGASGATRPRNLFLAGTATIGGNTTMVGQLIVDSTTDSSSTITGSIQTDGGVGIVKNLYVGGTVNLTTALTTGNGGTGLSSYTAGDLSYYATGTAFTKLAIGATNYVLTSSGTAPQWSQNLNIGSLTASADSSFTSTGALLISKGTSGEQPGSPVTGMLRYNTTSNQFEGYSGSSPAWNPVGGASLSNDTSTATNVYPLFANATTGSATTIYTSNAKLLYKPSTGEFQATVLDATNGIFVNSQTIASDYTIASTDNGGSFGPITVNSGITVTVSSGAVWTVV